MRYIPNRGTVRAILLRSLAFVLINRREDCNGSSIRPIREVRQCATLPGTVAIFKAHIEDTSNRQAIRRVELSQRTTVVLLYLYQDFIAFAQRRANVLMVVSEPRK